MNLCLAALATLLSFAFPAWAGTSSMTIAVSCVVEKTVDAGNAELLCAEMISTVSQTYPNVTFTKQDQDRDHSLVITIHTATAKAAELKLTWTAKNGQVFKGDRMSVSAMDTKLNTSKRLALYRRALAANPMPSS